MREPSVRTDAPLAVEHLSPGASQTMNCNADPSKMPLPRIGTPLLTLCRLRSTAARGTQDPRRWYSLLLPWAMMGLLVGLGGLARADTRLGLIGGLGGTPFDGGCPPDQNLGGFEVRESDFIAAIRPVCVVSLGPSAISASPVQPPFFGGPGGEDTLLMCPPQNPIVIGLDVQASGVEFITVDYIGAYCGKVLPGAQALAVDSVVSHSGSVRFTPIGGKERDEIKGRQQCPAGQVAVGVHGRSGSWLDAMGLICGPPRLTAAHVGGVPRLAGDRAMGQGPTAVPPTPVKKLGRVDAPFGSGDPPRPVCDVAQEARARNNSAAPGLEAQCRAVLASRGEAIANRDPLSAELRRRASNDPSRRGFDIGMAAAEGNTEPGPGKQAIHNALSGIEQSAYDAAVSFSLQRNRNAKFAATGAAIAGNDPIVAQARTIDRDVFYWLGFDIATGIFGDPALGAAGNTAVGPGSLGIRNALSADAQRGFNAAVALHLSRNYRR